MKVLRISVVIFYLCMLFSIGMLVVATLHILLLKEGKKQWYEEEYHFDSKHSNIKTASYICVSSKRRNSQPVLLHTKGLLLGC